MNDRLDDIARRAAGELAELKVGAGDSTLVHRRLLRRRVTMAGGGVAIIGGLFGAAVLAANADEDAAPPVVGVSTPTTVPDAVVSTTVVSTTEPTITTATSVPQVEFPDLPEILVTDGPEARRMRITGGELVEIGSVTAEATIGLGVAVDGGVYLQTGTGDASRIGGAGGYIEALNGLTLLDGGVIDSRPSLVVAALSSTNESDEPSGDVSIYDIETGNLRPVAPALALEYMVGRASFGGDKIAITASCDLSECLSYVNSEGTVLDGIPSPTDDLAYNAPPYVHQGVVSPDGSRLAYLEGPEEIYDEATGEFERSGEWVVVVMDLTSGDEVRRVSLGNLGDVTGEQWLDYDGRYLVISPGEYAGVVLAVDGEAADPQPHRIGVLGRATFVD